MYIVYAAIRSILSQCPTMLAGNQTFKRGPYLIFARSLAFPLLFSYILHKRTYGERIFACCR